jgi:DNA polymerase-1
MPSEKLLLVDSMALIHRGYYGVKERFTGEGEQTNATFGFAQTLLGLIEKEKPTHLALAWEGGRTFRHDIFPAYKSGRKPTPQDLTGQLPRCKELALKLGMACYYTDGYEGDDIIGVLATLATSGRTVMGQKPLPVVIATGDKDLLQLVSEHITVMLPAYGPDSAGQWHYYQRKQVIDRFGFEPELMPDFKAIAGDTSDSIPGVKGLGEKGACELIRIYGTIERMVAKLVEAERVGQLATKEETKFINDWQAAVLFKKVTTIMRYHATEKLNLERMAFPFFDANMAIDYFVALEFNELLGKLLEVSRAAPF